MVCVPTIFYTNSFFFFFVIAMFIFIIFNKFLILLLLAGTVKSTYLFYNDISLIILRKFQKLLILIESYSWEMYDIIELLYGMFKVTLRIIC